MPNCLQCSALLQLPQPTDDPISVASLIISPFRFPPPPSDTFARSILDGLRDGKSGIEAPNTARADSLLLPAGNGSGRGKLDPLL
ncbi:MAG: hypothetical protein BJ554DRAFT_2952 [Olpidium bornovanus]|uniref:Uncharacterized protein n=1 Tax=Olpidium bornovanus TaxID=278681 RepID=A0A8H7ZPI1_9FUNG|nr:MAG: hypothetical protein BJ554DRAFT_2952 [Olpidium bornovanus]